MSGIGDGLELRRLLPGEGEKLVACIRRCYGESHVDASLYDAGRLDAELASRRRHSAVALTPAGEVVGHLGLVIRHPGDNTADAGLTMVDPRFRGRGLAHRLALELGRLAVELGLVGLHDYPVTVHGGTQRLATDRALAVGFLLDNMPPDVAFHDMATAGSTAPTPSLVRYMGLRRAPERRVYLPAPYESLARSLYEAGGLPRHMEASGPGGRPSSGLEVDVERHERRNVVKLTLRSSGGPGRPLADALEAESAAAATQIDLPLSDPRTPEAVMHLRSLGFFFGALLPEFREGDVLRMQRLSRPATETAETTGTGGTGETVETGAAVLESDALRAIAEFVVRDATAVST